MIRIYMYKKPWRPDDAMSALFLYIYINYNNDTYTTHTHSSLYIDYF